MKTKIVKNEKAPYGRLDWRGRTPRWTCSWNLWKFMILKETMEDYFTRHPETRTTPEYMKMYDELCHIIQQMNTPLTDIVEEYPLF